MIANPSLEAFRYNPYDKSLTREHYETGKMLQLRRSVVLCNCSVARRV